MHFVEVRFTWLNSHPNKGVSILAVKQKKVPVVTEITPKHFLETKKMASLTVI